jgi:hypothetical protein
MIIELSALGNNISEQLENMGMEQIGTSVELLDKFNHAITLLHIHGLLTDSDCERARKRLIKKITVRVKPNF